MHWFPYILLAYVALGVQVGAAGFMTVGGITPNLPLVAAVFVAINAPRDASLLGCFFMGLLQDMLTQQPPGLHAFSYGLLAMTIGSSQSSVNAGHPLTHFFMTLLGAIVTGVVLILHGFLHTSEARLTLREHLLTIAYTAMVAPAVIWVLNRGRRLFAFKAPRKRGLSRA